MHLHALQLRRFCGFEDFKITFENCTVLIGPNNGGKTTILRAIKLVFAAMESEAFITSVQQSHAQALESTRHFTTQLAQLQRKPATQSRLHIPAATRSLEEQLAQQKEHILTNRRAAPGDLSLLARSMGFANLASFVYGHDLRSGFTIDLTIQVDGKDVHLIAELADQRGVFVNILHEGQSLFVETDPNKRALLEKVLKLRVEFAPPSNVGLTSTEQSLSWPQIKERIDSGRDFEVWRNRIHWLSEGKDPRRYQKVVDRIEASLKRVHLNAPGRTRDQQPNVTLTYEEKGESYDVSESGAGFRTLLGLANTIELSDADILLFDEPDAHLHSSVQKQVAEFLSNSASHSRQIIVSTHAPDMIEEFPLDTLSWIDRETTAASPADSISEAFVALGVANHRQAFHLLDAKAHLYFEDKPDEKALSRLLQKCGNQVLLDSIRAIRLRGAGDAKHLAMFARLIELHIKKRIPMAAILDADYEVANEPTPDGLLLTVRLPCKELENLLLLQPKAIFDRLSQAAGLREQTLQIDLVAIETLIDSETATKPVADAVRFNWIAKRCPDDHQSDASQLKKLAEDFDNEWTDASFRRRFCPGKQVLATVKRKLQEITKLSFTNDSAFEFYDPPEDIKKLFGEVQKHIVHLLAEDPATAAESAESETA